MLKVVSFLSVLDEDLSQAQANQIDDTNMENIENLIALEVKFIQGTPPKERRFSNTTRFFAAPCLLLYLKIKL